MSRSLQKAEEIAMAGENDSLDSQGLRDIMAHHMEWATSQHPLTSSPINDEDKVDDAIVVVRVDTGEQFRRPKLLSKHIVTPNIATDTNASDNAVGAQQISARMIKKCDTTNDTDRAAAANAHQTTLYSTLPGPTKILQPNIQGRLRSSEVEAEIVKTKKRMDASNPSVGSIMSATQEIPSQHYGRFHTSDIMNSSASDGGASQDDTRVMQSNLDIEADTGRISTLDFDQGVADPIAQPQNGVHESVADSPVNSGLDSQAILLPPETPASKNPFQTRECAVLPQSELFQATQPTPTGETQANGITPHHPSPYGIGMNLVHQEPLSSPLQRLAKTNISSASNHNIAASFSEGQNEPKVVAGSRPQLISSSMHEPRASYISRKESQQRRELLRTRLGPDGSQESDDGFDDIHEPRRRATAERLEATRGLVNISARGGVAIFNIEPVSDNVEVPSTADRQRDKRRRSDAEEYEAQCHGVDARDTQGDDEVIADSQDLDHNPQQEASKSTKSSQIIKESSLLGPNYTQAIEAITSSQTSTQAESADGVDGGPPETKEVSIPGAPEDDEPVPSFPAAAVTSWAPPDPSAIVTPRPHRISRDAVIPESSPAKNGVADGLRSFADIERSSGETAPSLNEIPSPLPDSPPLEEETVVVNSSSPVRLGPSRKITLDEIVVSTSTKSKPDLEEELELSEIEDTSEAMSIEVSAKKRLKKTYTKKGSPFKKKPQNMVPARSAPSRALGVNDPPITPLADGLSIAAQDEINSFKRETRGRRRITTNSTDNEGSVASPAMSTRVTAGRVNATGLFAGMTFVITSNKVETKKDGLEKDIIKRGGTVLSGGFEEFFDAASIRLSSPGKGTARHHSSDTSNSLVLRNTCSRTGFACVLANTHSRTPKYLQALALGLPCLSTRWVDHCIEADEIIDWEFYLLSAGESTLLGTVHSRVLVTYDATVSRFIEVFELRKQPLKEKKVLMIVGHSNKQEDSASTFTFLMRILGATKVGRAKDSVDARKQLTEAEGTPEDWDLLFTDKKVTTAEKSIFQTGHFPKLGKRKRASGGAADDTPAPQEIPIINNETIVQGLIDGRFDI